MSGDEISTRGPGLTFDQIRTRFDNEASGTTVESGSLQKFIEEKLAAIQNAGSFEEINAAAAGTGLTKSKDCIGRRFEISDLVMRESGEAFRDGSTLQKYVLIEATDLSTGEQLVIDGGGDTFLTQLISMRDHYDFPFTGTILAQPTSNGYNLLYWRFEDPKRKPLY